jgi:hypothetical protein
MRDRTNVRPIHQRIDPPITVSMDGDLVVIRPERRLDRDASMALIAVINAAVVAGATALIDLERGIRPRTQVVAARRSHGSETPRRPADISRSVTARNGITLAGPGCIRLATTRSCWTIDLTARRFCRSATPLEARFVAPDFWIGVRQIWITADSVTAITTADSLISSQRPGSVSISENASFNVVAS